MLGKLWGQFCISLPLFTLYSSLLEFSKTRLISQQGNDWHLGWIQSLFPLLKKRRKGYHITTSERERRCRGSWDLRQKPCGKYNTRVPNMKRLNHRDNNSISQQKAAFRHRQFMLPSHKWFYLLLKPPHWLFRIVCVCTFMDFAIQSRSYSMCWKWISNGNHISSKFCDS